MLPPTLQLASATQQTAPTRSGESAALGAFAKLLSASSKKSAEPAPATPALAGSHERATPDAIRPHPSGLDLQPTPAPLLHAPLTAAADENLRSAITAFQTSPTLSDVPPQDSPVLCLNSLGDTPDSSHLQGDSTLPAQGTVLLGDTSSAAAGAPTPSAGTPLLEQSVPSFFKAAAGEDKPRLANASTGGQPTSVGSLTPTANENQIAKSSILAPSRLPANNMNEHPPESNATGTQFVSTPPALIVPNATSNPVNSVAPAPQSNAKAPATLPIPAKTDGVSITAEKAPVIGQAPVTPERGLQIANPPKEAKPITAQSSGRATPSGPNRPGSGSNGKSVGPAPRNSLPTNSLRLASSAAQASSELNSRESGNAASGADNTNSTRQTPAPALVPAAGLTGDDSVTTNAVAIPANDGASSSRPLTARASLPPADAATAPEETPTAASSTSAGAEVVQAARIINQAGQSQLHLGLRTQAFGSVQLHTQIRDSGVELLVGSQKGELHSFLTPETLKSELSARDGSLRLHDMRFLSQEQNSNSGGGRSQSEPRAPVHENRNRDSDGSAGDRPETGEATLEASWIRGRVSIRA